MVICLERGADLHMAQLMPLPLTLSCFSKIQIGFTFLVPAHLGSPGQRVVKRVFVFAESPMRHITASCYSAALGIGRCCQWQRQRRRHFKLAPLLQSLGGRASMHHYTRALGWRSRGNLADGLAAAPQLLGAELADILLF